MNVSTILISQDEAQRKLEQYRSIVTKKRTKEDDKLQSLYAAVSKGARVINIANAFRETGLNEKHQPKLAIARADWPTVYCHRDGSRVTFGDTRRWNAQATTKNILLPYGTYNLPEHRAWPIPWRHLSSPVPHIPPQLRPKFRLHNYHILFEVESWEEYAVDPFLLRRIAGHLYVVEAEWELTQLEASLLGAMMQGN